MIATQCACGFTELDDEWILDHLAVVFTPDDSVGNDGKVHEELSGRACACGFSGITSEGLEAHFMEAFTSADSVGLDGKKHGLPEAAGRTAGAFRARRDGGRQGARRWALRPVPS